MNCLDFEVKESKVKVTTRSKSTRLKMLIFGKGVLVDGSTMKTI